MGNSFSTFHTSFNASSINNKLLDTLDVIASDLLFRSKLEDIIKLTKQSQCEKIIALSSDMLKGMNKTTLEYWSDRVKKGRKNVSPELDAWGLKKDTIIWTTADNMPNPEEKIQLCRSISTFYVMISQLYISILSALDPVYILNGVEHSLFSRYRSSSPIPPDVKISAKGIFHKMYDALANDFINNNNVLNPNYCNVHKDINSLMDISGVKELQGLYFDRWQINGSLYISEQNTDLYNKDVHRLYEQFVPPDERVDDPSQIKQFSDIPVKNTLLNPLCSSGVLKQPVFQTKRNRRLFRLYSENLQEMGRFAKKKEGMFLAILNTVFTNTNGAVGINPELTDIKLRKLINYTRRQLVDMYVEGQAFFVNGIKIYANILKEEPEVTSENPIDTIHDHTYNPIDSVEASQKYYNPVLLNVYNSQEPIKYDPLTYLQQSIPGKPEYRNEIQQAPQPIAEIQAPQPISEQSIQLQLNDVKLQLKAVISTQKQLKDNYARQQEQQELTHAKKIKEMIARQEQQQAQTKDQHAKKYNEMQERHFREKQEPMDDEQRVQKEEQHSKDLQKLQTEQSQKKKQQEETHAREIQERLARQSAEQQKQAIIQAQKEGEQAKQNEELLRKQNELQAIQDKLNGKHEHLEQVHQKQEEIQANQQQEASEQAIHDKELMIIQNQQKIIESNQKHQEEEQAKHQQELKHIDQQQHAQYINQKHQEEEQAKHQQELKHIEQQQHAQYIKQQHQEAEQAKHQQELKHIQQQQESQHLKQQQQEEEQARNQRELQIKQRELQVKQHELEIKQQEQKQRQEALVKLQQSITAGIPKQQMNIPNMENTLSDTSHIDFRSNDNSINNMFGTPTNSSKNTSTIVDPDEEINPFSHLNLGAYTKLPNSGLVDEEDIITTPIGLPPKQLVIPPEPVPVPSSGLVPGQVLDPLSIPLPLPGPVPGQPSIPNTPGMIQPLSRVPIELISNNPTQMGGLRGDDEAIYRYMKYLDTL